MKRHVHNAGCGELFCFHGAFTRKADAAKKEASTPGSFIRVFAYGPRLSDERYAVLTKRSALSGQRSAKNLRYVHIDKDRMKQLDRLKRKADKKQKAKEELARALGVDQGMAEALGLSKRSAKNQPPRHIRLDRAGITRYNKAREWMQDNSHLYYAAQPLAQDASTKYGVPVKDLLEEARKIKSSKTNPLFSKAEKRLMRTKFKRGVKRLFGFGERKKKTQPKATVAHGHRSTVRTPGVRDEVIEAVADQFRISRRKAEAMVPSAQGGDTFQSLFKRAMARVRSNPEDVAGVRIQLTPADRRSFDRATEFFQGFHGSDPKKVIRRHATVIESGDYSLVGRLYGFDLSDRTIKPYGEVQPNMQVRDNAEPIMLCGGSIERVPVDELRSVPSWVVPDEQGRVLVAHELILYGGDQNLEPVLESQFGITSTTKLVILGEITNIWYIAKKKQNNYKVTHYHHKFGEEEETATKRREARPWLMYDRKHRKMFIVGGEYSVPIEGIRN